MKIKNVAVLGAGTMGHGMAELAALASCNVVLCDISEELLAKALHAIKNNLDTMGCPGEFKGNGSAIIIQRIQCVTSTSKANRGRQNGPALDTRHSLRPRVDPFVLIPCKNGQMRLNRVRAMPARQSRHYRRSSYF